MLERILLVDDEENLLVGLKRILFRDFDITTAVGAAQGLELIASQPPFSVIVSDFRMPGMDGIQFLARVRAAAPDSVRVLFTGNADLRAATDAVNEGGIFRFLLKPAAPNQVIGTLQACIRQYRLVVAERELLEKTLRGAVTVMADILAAVSPLAFSRSARVRSLCERLAPALGLAPSWELEVASLLSQIGCVTIPTSTLEQKLAGGPLGAAEEKLIAALPSVGERLLQNIPRLEGIGKAIGLQDACYDARNPLRPSGEQLPPISRLLKVALDYDGLLATGKSPRESYDLMLKDGLRYDPKVLARLEELVNHAEIPAGVRKVGLPELAAGMLLAQDVRDKHGTMLIATGHALTDVLIFKLRAFALTGVIPDTLMVFEGSAAK